MDIIKDCKNQTKTKAKTWHSIPCCHFVFKIFLSQGQHLKLTNSIHFSGFSLHISPTRDTNVPLQRDVSWTSRRRPWTAPPKSVRLNRVRRKNLLDSWWDRPSEQKMAATVWSKLQQISLESLGHLTQRIIQRWKNFRTFQVPDLVGLNFDSVRCNTEVKPNIFFSKNTICILPNHEPFSS